MYGSGKYVDVQEIDVQWINARRIGERAKEASGMWMSVV
jgi:hypothetical protein